MIQHRDGNAAKSTIRCPHCAWENLRPRDSPGEWTIRFTCQRCGQWIWTARGKQRAVRERTDDHEG